MQNHSQIDIFASTGKLGVELSNMSYDTKELSKSCIDLTAELVKMIATNSREMRPIYGVSSESVWNIREVARQYNLDKVVIYPVAGVFNHLVVVFRFYGNSAEAAMKQLGVIPVPVEIVQKNAAKIAQCENDYGITLYDCNEKLKLLKN